MDKKHVLVIDDDPGVRMLLRKILESAGYRVSEAKNALDVFSIDTQRPPDLLILDIQMPGINGHQVLSSFKKDPNFHSPIIVLTGLADPKHKESSLAEGADAFMTKPPNRELLLAKVTELLNPRP